MNSLKNNLTSLQVENTTFHIAPTKGCLNDMADEISKQVIDGNWDSLDVAIRMNAMEQLAKLVKEKICEDVIHELDNHPKRKAEVFGAVVSEMVTIKYDYSDLPGWTELEEQIKVLKEQQKEIEDKERTYHKGDLPIKSASSTFKIQLSK